MALEGENLESDLQPEGQEEGQNDGAEGSESAETENNVRANQRVPLERLNEVIADRNELRQRLEVQERLLNNFLSQGRAQQAQQPDEIDSDENLDPSIKRALKTVLKKAEDKYTNVENKLRYAEMKNDFISSNPEAAKHIKEIEAYGQEMFRTRGATVPLETCWEVIRARKAAGRSPSRQMAAADPKPKDPKRAMPPVSSGGVPTKAKAMDKHGFTDEDIDNFTL